MNTSFSLSDNVRRFLSQSPVKMFIDGQWKESISGKTFTTLDPGTGEVIASVAAGDSEDIDRAVKAAQRAFKQSGWATMPARNRASILHALADLVDMHQEEMAQIEAMDGGKIIGLARAMDIPNIATTLRWFADLSISAPYHEGFSANGFDARRVRFPHGVAAFVLPWNFPALLLGWNIAPALAAGNAVVVKPAENTPLSSLFFCRLAEQAGIPPGIINVVPGFGHTAGAALSRHPGINHMGFTGSPEVGKMIASACGANLVPVKLELGGKGAAVVFEDNDIPSVAEQLVAAVTLHTGQLCCTATRWVIHERIWDRFIAEAMDRMKKITVGYEMDSQTQLGPVVSEVQQKRILRYLERGAAEGAAVLLEGGAEKVPQRSGGYYVRPALLTGSSENVCAREEIFGPVAFALPFRDEAEAVDIVNRSPYGLANSVWSSNLERANRVGEALVAGNTWINGHNLFPLGVPFGACKLSGFGGGQLSAETFFDYLRPQSIVRPL